MTGSDIRETQIADASRAPDTLLALDRGDAYPTDAAKAGEEEIFVRPWPALDATYQVSSDGGTEPLWAPDSRTLYYRHRADVIEVPITVAAGVIEPAAARVLFTGNYANDPSGDQSWDIGSDGRFLMLRPLPGEHIDLRVTLNWISGVRQRLERAQ